MSSLRLRRWMVGRGQPSADEGRAAARIRLRILFGFWISALVPGVGGGVRQAILWGSIIFGSVLAQELAHAAVGVHFGHRALIVLHPLGGLTEFEPPMPKRRRLLAFLAGPIVSLAIGSVLASLRKDGSSPVISFAMWVNWIWGAINLLPLLPFDGGRVMVELFSREKKAVGVIVSMALALAAANAGLVVLRSPGVTLLFMAAAAYSAFEWAKIQDQARTARTAGQLATAGILLRRERYFEARRVAEAIAQSTRDLESRNEALTTIAWAWLGEGRVNKAREALKRIWPANDVDGFALAAVEDADGNPDRAIAALENRRPGATMSREAVRLLVDLYARAGNLTRAAEVGRQFSDVLGWDDLARIARALDGAGEHELAATVRACAGPPEDPPRPPRAA